MTPDYSKLSAALNGYLAKMPTDSDSQSQSQAQNPDHAQTTNASIIGRLMSKVKMGYYPTCLEHMSHIVCGVEFPKDVDVNILDPCCGCGLALRALANGNNGDEDGSRCYTYGVELDSHRSQEALTRLDRVGFGSYFHSRISHEAFHAMLLNPPYLSVMTEGGNNTRLERRFLVDSICHLMYGGLIIYIVPHYRLAADICKVLADNFDDLTMWKFEGSEFQRFKQVAVMGVRCKRRDGSDFASELMLQAMEPNCLRSLSDLPAGIYQLPAKVKKVELFKGAEFNEAELAEQLKRSTSFSRLFEKSKLDDITKRPLLPLNIGQVGLIGGSGLINGLVECDTPHIIKGRIVKEKSTRVEETTDSRGHLISSTIYETLSNKMIFNLLTPQGFVSLTDYVSGIDDADDDEGKDCGKDNTVRDFPLGQIVVTANAANIISENCIDSAIARHESGDWGEVGAQDWKANDNAVKHGERILSSYTCAGGEKFWIITEADRSYTTVLLPEDY